MSCAANIYTVPVPGPAGATGAAGADGTNGTNAFATTTANFIMPAEAGTVVVDVDTSAPFEVGQYLFTLNGGQGFFRITAIGDATHITLLNLEDTATGAYPTNSPPGSVISSGAKLVSAGVQGPTGAAPSGSFLIVNDLLEGNPIAMRANLGLGTMAVVSAGELAGQTPTVSVDLVVNQSVWFDGTGIITKDAVTARVGLGLGAASLYQAGTIDGVLVPVDQVGGLVAGEALFATGSGVESLNAANARNAIRAYAVNKGILGANGAINFNAAGDYAIPILQGAAGYVIESVTLYNCSLNLTVATAGVFTSTGGGGVVLAADQSLASLTTGSKFKDLTLQAIVGTDWRTETTLYLRVGTPQGAAALGAVVIYGRILSV